MSDHPADYNNRGTDDLYQLTWTDLLCTGKDRTKHREIYLAVSIGCLLMAAIYSQIESHFLFNTNPFFYCALPALIIGVCAGHRLFLSSIECNIQSSVKDCVFSYKKSLFVGKSEDCSS